VIDGSAIVSVSIEFKDPIKANPVYIGMTDLLNRGDLCFCDQVVEELERTVRAEPPLMWASGCATGRPHKGAQYPAIEYVAQDFTAIIDGTVRDTQEPAALYVVAQALELQNGGHQITVVSEDRLVKPTRASLLEGCEHFSIRCIPLLPFLSETGIP
jgi:hypothetical protein